VSFRPERKIACAGRLRGGRCGGRCGLFLLLLQQPAAHVELPLAMAVRPKAVVPDALKTGGQDVQQETTQELHRQQRHRAPAPAVRVIFPSKADVAVVHRYQSLVGNRHAVRITCQIFQQPPLRTANPPILSQRVEQQRRQGHQPVLGSLARTHVNQHPLAVDVFRPQVNRLADPQPGGVDRQQDQAMAELGNTFQETRDFQMAEHAGELLGPFGIGKPSDRPVPAQRDLIQEP